MFEQNHPINQFKASKMHYEERLTRLFAKYGDFSSLKGKHIEILKTNNQRITGLVTNIIGATNDSKLGVGFLLDGKEKIYVESIEDIIELG